MKKYYLLFIPLLLLVSCGLLEGDDGGNGRSDSDASNEADTTRDDEPEFTGAPPADGKGNIFGEIRWNSEGVEGLGVKLCADFSSFSGCGSEEIFTETGENGQYLFADIEPGIYALSVKVPDSSNDWLYISSGILSSADFEVEAGKTLTIGIQNIFKLNLKPLTPINGGKAEAGEVPLEWEAYPEADYYKVSMYPDEGDAVLVNKRVNEPTITVDLPAVNCGYRWRVEAFNSDRVKIAEMAEQFDFTVAGQAGDCVLAIQEPADGAEIRGDNILLDWDDNPMAITYKILMWNDDDPDKENVLDFVEVNESSFRLAETLTPARYVWSVDAYDENGDKIGGTKIFDFTVRP